MALSLTLPIKGALTTYHRITRVKVTFDGEPGTAWLGHYVSQEYRAENPAQPLAETQFTILGTDRAAIYEEIKQFPPFDTAIDV